MNSRWVWGLFAALVFSFWISVPADEEVDTTITDEMLLNAQELDGIHQSPDYRGWRYAPMHQIRSGPHCLDTESGLLSGSGGGYAEAGEAGCIQCHSYRTRGGLLGPDLTNVAAQMPPEDIQSAVLQPSAHINPNFQTKQIQLKDGTRIEGRFRNETINHIQIANDDATLWRTYFKKDISKMRDGRKSLMPDDYGTKLTEEQQEQLFAFLDTLK